MTKKEAAILLVDMISDLRGYGADNQIYHEAVAIACAELLNAETAKSVMPHIRETLIRSDSDRRDLTCKGD